MATPPYFDPGFGLPSLPNIPISVPGSSSNNSNFFNSPLFGGILSGLGGLAQGILGNQAAGAQAAAATNASNSSNALLSSIYQQQRTDAAPYTLAGYGAVGKLQDMFGLNPGRYATAPTSTTQVSQPAPPPDPNGVFQADPRVDGTDSPFFQGYDGNGQPIFNNGANKVPNGSTVPLSSFSSTGSTPVGTSSATPTGGQLPADFGSMTHDFSLSDFNLDPGYQFRMDQGSQALQRSAAAKGSVLGGGTLKALSRYGQDYASNEFSNAFNRYQVNRSNQINPLFSLAGLGQTSAGQVATSGTSLGNNAANINFNGGVDAGAARASGYASTANAINSGISNTLYSLKNLGRG